MESDRSKARVVALVIGAVAGYLIYFFSLDLPNSGPLGERVSRGLMWQIAIGWTELPAPAIDAIKRLSTARHVPQRLPILGYAALIVIAATSTGGMILQALGYDAFALSTVRRTTNSEDSQASTVIWVECLVFAYGIGMSALSLFTLALGLVGWMNRPFVVSMLLAMMALFAVTRVWQSRRDRIVEWEKPSEWRRVRSLPAMQSAATGLPPRFVAITAGAVAVMLFAAISLFGALLPATDFDVREYHVQSPKEFYQAGRIEFVPHNVYANMPFGTEMLSLLGMIVAGDWWWGALVGQVTLATFSAATALGVFAFACRLFSRDAGLLAALIYLTTPWVYRISIIPYTEGALCFFLLASTLAATCAIRQISIPAAFRLWCIAGAVAGSAAACKYPALLSTVLPLGLAALLVPLVHWAKAARPSLEEITAGGTSVARHAAQGDATKFKQNPTGLPRVHPLLPVLAFTLGVAVTFGPWLAKNWIATGNPMYPLLFDTFGGRNWTPVKNAKWEWSHRVALLVALGLQQPPAGTSAHRDDPQHGITCRLFKENVLDVTAKDDRLSPLLFAFAPLALLRRHDRRAAGWLWLFVGFLFMEWWLLTHRLDRFWVPLVPFVAVLAGAGACWTRSRTWSWFLIVVTVPVLFFNFSYCTSGLAGDNRYEAYLADRADPLSMPVNWMNQHLPPAARVLAVGAADLFHLDRPVVYSTVFDDSIFEQLVRDKTPDSAARALHERGITHVYVSWNEVQRYRGTYGYPEFVQPAVFRELTEAGVLRPLSLERSLPLGMVDFNGERVRGMELYEVVSKHGTQ